MLERVKHGWTAERVARLRELWTDGFSAAAIAIDLGGGVTRSAVIGKISRLKLPKRLAAATHPQHMERRAAQQRQTAKAARKRPKAKGAARAEAKSKSSAILAARDTGKRTPKGTFEADPAGAAVIARQETREPVEGSAPVEFRDALAGPGCRWMFDSGANSLTCNEPVHARSFCQTHFDIVYP